MELRVLKMKNDHKKKKAVRENSLFQINTNHTNKKKKTN